MRKLFTINFMLLVCLQAFAQNTPVIEDFTTFNSGTSFSCITVDANNNVWAGTNKQGLFHLDQATSPDEANFTSTGLSTLIIQSLAADQLGGLWVGHGGINFNSSSGGLEWVDINNPGASVHYSPDRNAKCFDFMEREGLATLNVKSVTVDHNNTVWTAHKYHQLAVDLTYILTPGAMSSKKAGEAIFTTKGGYDTRGSYPEWPYPAYTCNPKPNETAQSRSCYSIASDSNEVWISVFPYTTEDEEYLPARILTYDLNGSYKGALTFESIGVPTAGAGIFNGIYLSPKGDAWVSVSAGKGFAVRRNGAWTHFNSGSLPCIFPEGANVNENAIWGNKYGNVFIGTNKGLIVYNGRGPVNVSSSYSFYSQATNTMSSNNILGGYSERDSIQWIASDNGIMKAIIGRYPTDDEENGDFASCNSSDMNYIEGILKQPATQANQSYHVYKVETEICDQTGPNGSLCNAENIYKMFKDDITLTSPTPIDFPYDNLSPVFLSFLDDSDLNTIIANVNAFQANPTGDNPTGGISTIGQMLMGVNTTAVSAHELFGIPSYTDLLRDKIQRPVLLQEQIRINGGVKTEACKEYQLFNSSNFILSRKMFDLSLENLCRDSNLESAVYDPIFVYPSDKDYTITNYTKDGHFLWPGKVTRQVVEECGKVKIVTIGEGLQYCGDNKLGKMNAKGNVVVGTILFRNIDFRLKRTFEEL